RTCHRKLPVAASIAIALSVLHRLRSSDSLRRSAVPVLRPRIRALIRRRDYRDVRSRTTRPYIRTISSARTRPCRRVRRSVRIWWTTARSRPRSTISPISNSSSAAATTSWGTVRFPLFTENFTRTWSIRFAQTVWHDFAALRTFQDEGARRGHRRRRTRWIAKGFAVRGQSTDSRSARARGRVGITEASFSPASFENIGAFIDTNDETLMAPVHGW